MSIKEQLANDMKTAMRARDKARLGVIRMTQTEIKQREIDGGKTLADGDVQALIEKMIKKRRDAEAQYRDAGRAELADGEAAEIAVLEDYLPAKLASEDVDAEIQRAIDEKQAASMKDMGAVMGVLKARLQGRADLGDVSQRVKHRLAG